ALSDEEVDMIEERGKLWHLKYPLLDASGAALPGQFVVVATTRPETMLGDEAVAVHPGDPRYRSIAGGRALLPLRNKPIPIIDDDFVDPKFGTGCVKVTPAHDPNDYEMGLRHHLPLTTVIGLDGRMTPEAGPDFAGLDRMAARKKVIEQLEALGLLLKTEDYTHTVGYSERSKVPIEPCLSEQWFLKYPSVEESRAVVATGGMKFYPERWAKVYDHWMEGIKDWCISRQLWWGHRIPVWRWKGKANLSRVYGELLCAVGQDVYEEDEALRNSVVIRLDGKPVEIDSNHFHAVADSGDPINEQEAEHEIVICACNEGVEHNLNRFGYTQDPDVLDTWFSSWLWPFATMGWPDQTETLQKFYPTSDLVTGPDIIFFWVARMIMAGYEFTGTMPFRNVYFTGIIRDKQGRKMSKSLGNSPDPLDLIAQYGADALRFGVIRSAPLGQDVLYDEQQVELGRNFCNKLWNACRFRQMQPGETEGEIRPDLLTGDDKWILLKLDQAITELSAALAQYKFNEAAQTLYRFFWSEYCDWYLEAAKAALAPGHEPAAAAAALQANTLAVMDFVLSNTLRLFHPFLPFITEELWHGLGYHLDLPAGQGGDTIMFARWPQPLDEDFKTHYGLQDRVLTQVEARNELLSQGRNLRRTANLPGNKKVKYIFKPAAPPQPRDLAAMQLLLNADPLEVRPDFTPPKGTPAARSPLGELFLPLEGVVDLEAEKKRLQAEMDKCRMEVGKVKQKLANPAFVQKAPPAVLEEHRKRLAAWQAKEEHLLQSLRSLGG
ncbi:MAG: valine--tRNA ligase, partial [Verrucomicrobiota bacterium]